MGHKQHTACAAIACALLMSMSLTAQASSARDLYSMYDRPYTSETPEEVFKVITDYQDAQKFLQQYRYVKTAYDITQQVDTQELRDKLASLAVQLRNGFYLSSSEIASLESAYRETLTAYNHAVKKNASYSVESPITVGYSVPSESEYQEALRIHAEYQTRESIGNLDNLKLFSQASLIDDFDDTSVTYMVADGTPALSLFNGEVKENGEDYVIIDCYNGITLYYEGLSPSVVQGDILYQGKVLGYSSRRVTVKLQLGEDYVSVYELLEGGNNEND